MELISFFGKLFGYTPEITTKIPLLHFLLFLFVEL